MQINVTGHRIEVTPALRTLTEEKFEKLARHFDRITTIHVTFDIEKLCQIAEASVKIAKSELHARAESDDLYTSIDELVDKLDRQLTKHKDKTHTHRE